MAIGAFGILAFTVAPLAAQITFLSPWFLSSTEGTHSSSIPFDRTQPTRYMQVHTDTTNRVMNIRQLSFRQNGASQSFSGVRAISLELYLGYSKQYDHMQSLDYMANYASARTRVIARRTVNFGPQGQASPGGGNSFTNLDLSFDQQFPYDGLTFRSLLWEVLVFSNSLTGTFNTLDSEIGTPADNPGQVTVTGAGCTATGATLPVTQALSLGANGDSIVLGWSLVNAPPHSLAALSFGSLNPNAPVPGMCSNLQTNMLSVMNMGATDAQGQIPLGGNGTWIVENHWDDQTLFTQFHIGDAGRSSPIKVANSNGLRIRLPRSNTTRTLQVTRLWNDDGTTTATRAVYMVSGLANCGLVTRFTY
jgi:hypothetical protein